MDLRRKYMGLRQNTWILQRKKAVFNSMNSKTLLYILKRIGLAVLTVWVVITVTFFVMRAVPGGPFLGEKAISPAAQAACRFCTSGRNRFW